MHTLLTCRPPPGTHSRVSVWWWRCACPWGSEGLHEGIRSMLGNFKGRKRTTCLLFSGKGCLSCGADYRTLVSRDDAFSQRQAARLLLFPTASCSLHRQQVGGHPKRVVTHLTLAVLPTPKTWMEMLFSTLFLRNKHTPIILTNIKQWKKLEIICTNSNPLQNKSVTTIYAKLF